MSKKDQIWDKIDSYIGSSPEEAIKLLLSNSDYSKKYSESTKTKMGEDNYNIYLADAIFNMNLLDEKVQEKIFPLIENNHLVYALQSKSILAKEKIGYILVSLDKNSFLYVLKIFLNSSILIDKNNGKIAVDTLKLIHNKLSDSNFFDNLFNAIKDVDDDKNINTDLVCAALQEDILSNYLLEFLYKKPETGRKLLLSLEINNKKWRGFAVEYIKNQLSGISHNGYKLKYKRFLVEFLEKIGILVFGNLEKTDKIKIINCDGEIQNRLLAAITPKNEEKRNRIVANLGFYISCTGVKDKTTYKLDQYISIPLKLGEDFEFTIEKTFDFLQAKREDKDKKEVENKDSESALCHALTLNRKGILDQAGKDLNGELNQKKEVVSKLRSLVLEIYSDNNACDHCRGLLINQLLVTTAYLRQLLNHIFGYKVPIRDDLKEPINKGIGLSILYFYGFQPTSSDTGHSYKSKDHHSTDNRRRAFYSNGLFIPVFIEEKPKLDPKEKPTQTVFFSSKG